MSHAYRAVGWNRQKRIYDLTLWGCILLFLLAFIIPALVYRSAITPETLIIRATGTAAIVMLHILLIIGPLCRLFPKLLPLLYNRRHFGVSLFLVALLHGAFAIIQFHGFGDLNPLVSVLSTPGSQATLSDFQFQPLGLAALFILFIMAATSHDFWLANLTAPVWKAIHMLVYLAYGLLIMHVILGVLQAETHPLYLWILASGMLVVLGLHLVAAFVSTRLDTSAELLEDQGWLRAVSVDEIPESRARIATIAGERVAIFKYAGKIAAVSNVCQHQNGPLGEGKVIDGCITCPWHGYQYRLEDGRSPPPFSEKIPTFRVRLVDNAVWIHQDPLPAGTPTAPALIASDASP